MDLTLIMQNQDGIQPGYRSMDFTPIIGLQGYRSVDSTPIVENATAYKVIGL